MPMPRQSLLQSRLPIIVSGLLIAAMPLFASSTSAHPGGQDECHCHTNKKTGEYHCHSGKLAGQSFDSKEQMLAMLKVKKLSKVCR